mgnify:FL=1
MDESTTCGEMSHGTPELIRLNSSAFDDSMISRSLDCRSSRESVERQQLFEVRFDFTVMLVE